MGFEAINFAGAEPLQTLLAKLNKAGEISPLQAKQLRKSLRAVCFLWPRAGA